MSLKAATGADPSRQAACAAAFTGTTWDMFALLDLLGTDHDAVLQLKEIRHYLRQVRCDTESMLFLVERWRSANLGHAYLCRFMNCTLAIRLVVTLVTAPH